ncbi:hypothetical protein CYMTET_6611 [Cymbomonas tetramitiformis]|uniref:Uncharacterized protein n=1 Tax=Cymbomonas tetramitiformis TaxID=36881 RepID=A0AAE0GX41_9CHLO|nr:hypothetical protein CYMTET_6611 [Cymbomonas tetramitiformis]
MSGVAAGESVARGLSSRNARRIRRSARRANVKLCSARSSRNTTRYSGDTYGDFSCGLGQNMPEIGYAVVVGVGRLNLLVAVAKTSNERKLWGGVLSLGEYHSTKLRPVAHAVGVGHTLDLVA